MVQLGGRSVGRGVLTLSVAGTASAATPATTQTGAQAVTFWNGVAVNVIVVDAGKANAEAFLWYGFTQAAVYNAVNGITGRYELYRWNPTRPQNAKPKAAAAAAAYTLLLHYFPLSQPRLDAAYAEALGQVADGRPSSAASTSASGRRRGSSRCARTTAVVPTRRSRSRRGRACGARHRQCWRRSSPPGCHRSSR